MVGWIVKDQVSEKPSPGIAAVLRILKTHEILSICSILALLFLCIFLWLLADRKEALEKIIDTGLVFVPSRKLRPDHLSLVAFNPRYVEHAEVADAQQKLAAERLLLILGRPSGGKSRLAYNLAKQSKRHWILRVPPGFLDWKGLNFPRIPHRCKVLWIVDDVDKFLGKSDIPQGERILGAKCDLKMIVTCRSGRELEQARSDKELAAFLERLPAVTCSDFAQTELVSLAQQVGKSIDPDLFDLTPGSVLLDLELMRRRLQNAGREAQAVMMALHLLRSALIFSPTEDLVVAVVTKEFKVHVEDNNISATLQALVRDDFLRPGQPLVVTHDSYLSTDFFPYYATQDSHLEHDLLRLGEIVEQHGTQRDFQSLGVYWRSRKNYERALPYLQKAVTFKSRDPVLVFDLGFVLYQTGRFEEAVKAFQTVLDIDPDKASALFNKGVALGELNRSKEAIQAYDEVLHRFGDATEPELRVPVAMALVYKGVRLGELNRSEEEIQAYDEVLRRFSDAPEPALREQVATALVYKGIFLGELNRSEEAIQAYDEVLHRFGDATEPALREQVATALVYKGDRLGELNRREEAIQAYDEVLHRFSDSPEPALREQVATAFVNKGITLGQVNRGEEEIQAYEKVLRRFSDAPEPALREQVATALVYKGLALNTLKRPDDAKLSLQEVLVRFGGSPDLALQQLVEQARAQLDTC